MARKDKILSEDQSIQGNRWQQDPSGKVQNIRQISLLDLVNMTNPDVQNPNNVPSSQTPIHGSQNFLELVSDIYLNCDNLETAITLVSKSPVLKDKSSSQDELKQMFLKVQKIKKLIELIGKDIDGFAIDKPTD